MSVAARDLTPLDQLITYPAAAQPPVSLNEQESRAAAGLMRVNHSGEIAAQALYRGQSVTARNPATRDALIEAAREEQDHLAWCETRLAELGAAPSRLNPLWYIGSFAIGLAAGAAGHRVSLGFVAETERQVEGHLDEHLAKLPATDARSRRILEAMKQDEIRHGQKAAAAGAAALPALVRRAMTMTSRVMTRTAYWI